MGKQTRREFIKKIGLTMASERAMSILPGVAGISQVSCSKRKMPNVLLIITDNQGWGDIHSHGNDKINTPVMDRLASDGIRFDRFFVSSVCAPTRASLLTGRYYLRTSIAFCK